MSSLGAKIKLVEVKCGCTPGEAEGALRLAGFDVERAIAHIRASQQANTNNARAKLMKTLRDHSAAGPSRKQSQALKAVERRIELVSQGWEEVGAKTKVKKELSLLKEAKQISRKQTVARSSPPARAGEGRGKRGAVAESSFDGKGDTKQGAAAEVVSCSDAAVPVEAPAPTLSAASATGSVLSVVPEMTTPATAPAARQSPSPSPSSSLVVPSAAASAAAASPVVAELEISGSVSPSAEPQRKRITITRPSKEPVTPPTVTTLSTPVVAVSPSVTLNVPLAASSPPAAVPLAVSEPALPATKQYNPLMLSVCLAPSSELSPQFAPAPPAVAPVSQPQQQPRSQRSPISDEALSVPSPSRSRLSIQRKKDLIESNTPVASPVIAEKPLAQLSSSPAPVAPSAAAPAPPQVLVPAVPPVVVAAVAKDEPASAAPRPRIATRPVPTQPAAAVSYAPAHEPTLFLLPVDREAFAALVPGSSVGQLHMLPYSVLQAIAMYVVPLRPVLPVAEPRLAPAPVVAAAAPPAKQPQPVLGGYVEGAGAGLGMPAIPDGAVPLEYAESQQSTFRGGYNPLGNSRGVVVPKP